MKTVSETESFLRIQLLKEQIETLKVERALKLKEAGFKYDESLLHKPLPRYHSPMITYSLGQQEHWIYDELRSRWVPRFHPAPADEEPPPMSFPEPSSGSSPEPAMETKPCSCTTCTNKRSW